MLRSQVLFNSLWAHFHDSHCCFHHHPSLTLLNHFLGSLLTHARWRSSDGRTSHSHLVHRSLLLPSHRIAWCMDGRSSFSANRRRALHLALHSIFVHGAPAFCLVGCQLVLLCTSARRRLHALLPVLNAVASLTHAAHARFAFHMTLSTNAGSVPLFLDV